MTCSSSLNAYQFPPSLLQVQSQAEFGLVDWWTITQTDPQDDEVPTGLYSTIGTDAFVFALFADSNDATSSNSERRRRRLVEMGLPFFVLVFSFWRRGGEKEALHLIGPSLVD